jgi:hypothetical protein
MSDPFGAMTDARFATYLPNMAQLMAIEIAKGAVKGEAFTRAAVEAFGEGIRPHIDRLYASSEEVYKERYAARFSASNVRGEDKKRSVLDCLDK